MTLDEAIKQCEEIADYDCYNDSQRKRAEDYRQLATWLRDYKRLLAKESGKLRCRTCVHFEDDEAEECGRCFEYSAWEGEQDE